MPAAASLRIKRDVVIVDTCVGQVEPPDGELHYEIHVASDHERTTPRHVFLTRVWSLYERAAGAEDSPRRFDVHWRPGRRHDGKPCQVLEQLEPSTATEGAS